MTKDQAKVQPAEKQPDTNEKTTEAPQAEAKVQPAEKQPDNIGVEVEVKGNEKTVKLTRAEAWARVEDARKAGVRPSLAGFNLAKLDFTNPQHKRRNEGGKIVTDTILVGMDLHGVDFSGANLEGTVFINANLQGCTFTGCKGTPKLEGADLRWALDKDQIGK